MSSETPYPTRTLAGRPWRCSRKCDASSTKFFPSEILVETGEVSGLIERERKLTASVLATTLSYWKGDCLGYSDMTADIALKLGENVSKQSLQEKLDSPAAEVFFQTLVVKALNAAQAILPKATVSILGVRDIFIAEASTLALRQPLAVHLPGTGGSGPKASVQIHGLVNMTSGQFARIALSDGKTSDHSEKGAHALLLREADLIIRDMGYFDLADLDALLSGERLYLTRIPLSTRIFTDLDGTHLDFWLGLGSSTCFTLDRQIKVGDDGFVTRLVALRLPKREALVRLAAARKENGRPLSAVEKAQARWNLLMTDPSPEQASVDTLQKLHSWRWQIELIWKAWKRVLDLDSAKTATCTRPSSEPTFGRASCLPVVMMAVRSAIQSARRQEIGVICWFRRLSPSIPPFAACCAPANGAHWLDCSSSWLVITVGARNGNEAPP